MGETLNLDTIAKIDKSNMLKDLIRFPEMCEEALSSKVEILPTKPENIIITGMGGSGIVGDILKSWLDLDIPLAVCKNYEMPSWISKKSLIVAVSYSGNTEETLACVSKVIEKNSKWVAITSGGKLAEICEKRKVPWIKIPSGLAPRAALPYTLFSAILVFKKLGLIADKDKEIDECIKLLKTMREELRPEKENNQAERIAQAINGKIPVIYAPLHLEAVALRLKNQFSENSKIMSKTEFFPELCHNEIVGLNSAPDNFSFLFMRDTDENPRMRKQIEFTEKLLKEKNPIILWTRGSGKLARILSLVYLGDFISFYLAILRRVDPTPVTEISLLKKEMAK